MEFRVENSPIVFMKANETVKVEIYICFCVSHPDLYFEKNIKKIIQRTF